MIPIRPILFFTSLLLLSLVSCRKVKPNPPQAAGFDSPIADVPSYLTGLITFDLAALEKKINTSLSPVLVGEDTMEGKPGAKWHLRVERTGPIHLQYAHQRVTMSAPLRVWISSPLQRKQKKNQRSLCALSVNFQTPLTVSNDWRLKTKTSFTHYTWIERPTVRILGLTIGVTKLADNILRKNRTMIESILDSVVHSELRLDQQVVHIWRDIQKPLLLSKQPDSLWLVPMPRSVMVGPIVGNTHTITVPIRVGFRTATWFGLRPVVPVSKHLPRLQRIAQLPDKSDLRVLCFVPYADMNRVLRKQLKGHTLKLLHGELTIKDASVYGGQQAIILKTEVRGTVNGTLYFKGQPSYDTLRQTLKIRRVDFTVETEEMLFSTANWLLHDKLRDTLQSVLTIPLGSQIAGLPQKIETAYKQGQAGKKTLLDIETFRFVPQQLAIRPDGLQALIKVESKVNLAVKRL